MDKEWRTIFLPKTVVFWATIVENKGDKPMIDFSKIRVGSVAEPIDPRDVFMGLLNRSTKYSYPRDVQSEVWKQWFSVRNEKDCIIKMNTGSGKTVVALLILQSCLNEGFGPALYVVPDKYLVDQVVGQAKELGIRVVTAENDNDYIRSKAIMVISIHKLINGKSRFGMQGNNYSIGSIVIDDVHACVNTIQSQFSLRIVRERESELFDGLLDIVSEALRQQSQEHFEEIKTGAYCGDNNMLVPFWAWHDCCKQVYELLNNNHESENLLFRWDLVKDCLKFSHCYVSNKEIDIIPNCIPIHVIKSLNDAKRKIFMSATLPDDSPFITVMGERSEENISIITPEKANDIGERLVIFPKIINSSFSDEEVEDVIVEKSKDYNVVVLVPSNVRAAKWKEKGAVVLSSENINEGIEQIKNGKKGLYVFVNRYDGIDLPDDACRILVIDGLPNVENLNDKYENEVIGIRDRIQREQITKIEQGIGRGIRSNNDYCLVYLLGNELTNVLYSNKGYEYFGEATKQQFLLSEQMWDMIKDANIEGMIELGDYLLKRDPNWMRLCKEAISAVTYNQNFSVTDFAAANREAFDYCLHDDFQKAHQRMNQLVNKEENTRIRGFYRQLVAEYMDLDNPVEAQLILKTAKSENMYVLTPREGIHIPAIKGQLLNQVQNIINLLDGKDKNSIVINIDSILDDLRFVGHSSTRFEHAIREVFSWLGYNASEPEREDGKGPDDFVYLGENNYLIIECKNETTTETINKRDCNQLNGSIQWFKGKYPDATGVPIMIHNSSLFEYACSPESTIRIMNPDCLEMFKQQVRTFFSNLCSADCIKDAKKIGMLLNEYGLTRQSIVERYTVKYKQKNS